MGDINRQIGMARGSDRSARATTIFRVIIEKMNPTKKRKEYHSAKYEGELEIT